MLLSNSSTKKGTKVISKSVKAFQDASLQQQIDKITSIIDRAITQVSFRPSLRNVPLHPDVKELFKAYGYVLEIEKDRLVAGTDELIIRLAKSTEPLVTAAGNEFGIRPALEVKSDLYRRAEGKYSKEIEEIDDCIFECLKHGSTDVFLKRKTMNDFLLERYQKQGYFFKEFKLENKNKTFFAHLEYEMA